MTSTPLAPLPAMAAPDPARPRPPYRFIGTLALLGAALLTGGTVLHPAHAIPARRRRPCALEGSPKPRNRNRNRNATWTPANGRGSHGTSHPVSPAQMARERTSMNGQNLSGRQGVARPDPRRRSPAADHVRACGQTSHGAWGQATAVVSAGQAVTSS